MVQNKQSIRIGNETRIETEKVDEIENLMVTFVQPCMGWREKEKPG